MKITADQFQNQLYNGPDHSDTFKCGNNRYTGKDIYLAAQRGTNLYLVGETRGSTFLECFIFSFYPLLTLTSSCIQAFISTVPQASQSFAAVSHSMLTPTLEYGYPHSFKSDDSLPRKLKFPKECPANDDSRMSFPLKRRKPYDGGPNNLNTGEERVVFYYEDGEISNDGNPQVYYCGIMTHIGTSRGNFVQC